MHSLSTSSSWCIAWFRYLIMCWSVSYEKRMFMMEDALWKYEGAVDQTQREKSKQHTCQCFSTSAPCWWWQTHSYPFTLLHGQIHTLCQSFSWALDQRHEQSMIWAPNVTIAALNIPQCVGLGCSGGAAASFPWLNPSLMGSLSWCFRMVGVLDRLVEWIRLPMHLVPALCRLGTRKKPPLNKDVLFICQFCEADQEYR